MKPTPKNILFGIVLTLAWSALLIWAFCDACTNNLW